MIGHTLIQIVRPKVKLVPLTMIGAVAICGVIIFYIDASTVKVVNFLGVEQLSL